APTSTSGSSSLSHYHGDHVGLATKILPNIPIYMGEKSYEIHKVSNEYIKKEYLKETKTFKPNEEFFIGDIKIITYLCDHSAFDAYMFLVECEGKKILYTGDFRSNGRKSFEAL
ncbi:MBL fold metallo-hydrolase, partial [Fusobacterium sp. HMSC064B11]